MAVCLVLGWGLFGPRGLELHQRVLIQAIGIDKTATGYQVTLRAASTSQQVEDRLYTCAGATLEDVYKRQILYFVAANALSLGAFLELLEERLHPEFPLVLILAVVVAVAAYGAWRGLETIARAGACLCVLVLAGTALLFGTAAGRFQWENLQPLGDAPALRGAAVFLSRTSLFAEMAVLLPYVRGRRGLGFALWSLGTTVFVAALTLLLAGCLGPYAATQDFPVYTLASLSEVASLQRLEPVFAVLWMAGLLPQVAMGLYACRV